MRKKMFILLGSGLLSVSALLLLVFFLNGNVTFERNNSKIEKTTTLECKAEGFWYPLFVYDNSSHRSIDLNLVFNGDGISTMSILYALEYDNKNQAIKSEAENHAKMNAHYSDDGLNPDAFSSLYTIIDNNFTFSIYADEGNINRVAYKYFLLSDYDGALGDMEKINNYYTDKGLNCVTSK